MSFSDKQIQQESKRLFDKLQKVNWSEEDCEFIAPLTLEINELKKEKGALILAHSYETPDIKYGIADFIGDSYDLSMTATKSDADIIVFCSVYFMGETAKILSPNKTVLVPAVAGCSLADAITPEDVRRLKKEHPGSPVVCYVNTTATVKAESDVCCTSSNALKIINAMKEDEIIFIPDEFMAKNFQALTNKKIIPWKGRCVAHEKFTPKQIQTIRDKNPGIKILAHPECPPDVIGKVDFVSGTDGMLKYVKKSPAKKFMLVTECGLSERVNVEFVDKQAIGTCPPCPYMKEIILKDVLQALQKPRPDQIIEIPSDILKKVKKALNRMVEIVEREKKPLRYARRG